MSEQRAKYTTKRPKSVRLLKDGVLSEKAFSQQVTDYARLRGWMVYRTWTSIHSPAGWPDLVLLKNGEQGSRLVFAELKSARGWVSVEQRRWLDALRRWAVNVPSASVYLWRPADWDTITALLDEEVS